MSHKTNVWWTFAITSAALFMVTLDNLVVTTAIPVIRRDLHAGLSGLEWTVNAYTLVFAVLLLTGAALGDRFGRRLMFSIEAFRSSRITGSAVVTTRLSSVTMKTPTEVIANVQYTLAL